MEYHQVNTKAGISPIEATDSIKFLGQRRFIVSALFLSSFALWVYGALRGDIVPTFKPPNYKEPE